ncbi:MAG TPA: hypothetical protein VNK41_11215 [Vicinamibacterales bacterium]|nr:hypothetical protein [Vicinamibacterales bacterium]
MRDVIGTVPAQLTNKPTSDRDQAQIELERRVAEKIARGLSS